MRRLAGASVLTLLVVIGLLFGSSIALADSTAAVGRHHQTWSWPVQSGGAPGEPSGVAYVGDGSYLVVDTNHNDPQGFNGWVMDPDTGSATNVNVEVEEDDSTGVDFDPIANRLFISSDDGFIRVINNYGTVSQSAVDLNTEALLSFDTEDPAYDRETGILYWVDGIAPGIFWIDPVDGVFGNGNDKTGMVNIDSLRPGSDWEALGWDPATENLLVAPRRSFEIFEVTIEGGSLDKHGTINASAARNFIGDISGLGAGSLANTLWVTSRDSATVLELGYNGTTPPSTTTTTTTTTSSTTTTSTTTTTTLPTTTTQPSTTTTQPTTTTTKPSPTTTQPSTTTTQPTTTTTKPSTTTTQPSTTTTTTQPTTTTTTTPSTTTTTTQPPNPPPPPPANGFLDTQSHTFRSSIDWLVDEGITKGCNPPANDRFCPEGKMTRGQMAAFLVRAFGYTDDGGGSYFGDIAGNTFENDINRLRAAGITQGCNPPANDRFCPDGLVTRGQMAAFLVRAFEFIDPGNGGYFTDTIGNTFEYDIDRLRAAAVTLGCNPPANDRYCPDELVTRGQMAAFLQRGFGK